MKVRSYLFGGLFVAALGLVAVGCNENPIDTPPGDGVTPNPVRSLSAVSLGATSIGVKWDTPAADTGTATITYRVHWAQDGNPGADSGSVNGITNTSTTLTVQAGKAYDIDVYAVRSSKSSSVSSITWAGATRTTSTSVIRLYETQSSNGSGLVLDPALGGPTVQSVSASSNPTIGNVQVAIYTHDTLGQFFVIGPARYFKFEYQAGRDGLFNANVNASDSAWPTTSLDGWYLSKDLTNWFTQTTVINAFKLPITQTNNGQVFYVRTGPSTDYHYARIFVKNSGGKLLQGSAPNRFVELEISYQTGANLPYAKTVAGHYTPANFGAQTRR